MKRRLPLALFFVLFLALGTLAQLSTEEGVYLSPGEIAVSRDGRWLYVVCENSDELRVVDSRSRKVVKTLPVGHVPRDVTLSADGKRLYVTNSWVDTVSVIDADKLQIIGAVKTGFEPISAVPDLKDQTLYVANRLSNDISVIDLRNGQEIKRLTAGRGASYMAISADGSRIYGSHIYPRIEGNRHSPDSEITVIDTASQRVVERDPLHNVAGVFHIALSADGKLGVAAELRPKNLIPLAHVEHGWVFGDALTVFGADVGGTVEVPIDELERYFARPFGVAITPDKSKIFVTAGGSDNVTVIGVARLLKFIRARHRSFANDLSASANYVIARIAVGRNPRGVALSPDGKLLYVANRMDDNLSVIDTAADRVVSTIDLGGPKTVTPIRRGEQIFYTTKFSFQGQFGCANCHLDATFDGMEWDLEPDGFGLDIVDNRSIEDLSGTEPFKWNGGNPNMPTECGPRTEKYFYRSQSYNSRELADLVTFVLSLPVRPNRYRSPDGTLTPAQERGKAIFERTHYKNGKPIPETNQCAYCHSGPKYTDRRKFDVGSGKPTDTSSLFDVPHLPDIVYSAPYLHDGSARSLEEIWTVFNPKDTHGVTNDLTKDELNDLIEYLQTL
jgi:YVTN family beta-propeller protein